MANSIKRPSDGLAYQITRPAREAGLVEENEEGDASYLATVRVHAVDGLLLIVDVDDLTNEEEADLHATAIQDTDSTYTSIEGSVTPSGNGYQVQVSNAPDANLMEGDTPSETTAPGVVILAGKSRNGGSIDRLASDLATIRNDQIRR
jgi:hypothetical protein